MTKNNNKIKVCLLPPAENKKRPVSYASRLDCKLVAVVVIAADNAAPGILFNKPSTLA